MNENKKINIESIIKLGFQRVCGQNSEFWQRGKIMITTNDYSYFIISTGTGTLLFKIDTVKKLKKIINSIIYY